MGLTLSTVRALGSENIKEARKLLKAFKNGQDVEAHFSLSRAQEEKLKELIPGGKLNSQPEEDTVILSALDKRLTGSTVKSDIDVSATTHGDSKLIKIEGFSSDKDGILQTHEYKLLTNPEGTIITGRTEGCGMDFELEGAQLGLSNGNKAPEINYLEQDGQSLITMENIGNFRSALAAPTEFLNKSIKLKSKGLFETAASCVEAMKKTFTPQG